MTARKTIWSVGGGKGGIGKSVTAANIGVALAKAGRKVILVDADLGGANLHTYFGIKYPPKTLEDFLKGRFQHLSDVMLDTQVEGLGLISGGAEFLGIANPASSQKQKLINNIKKLDADHILVDLGAGSTYNILDFFAISNEGIVVLVPEPAAIQNAYIFLKSFVYRRLVRLFTDNPLISDLIKEATDPHSKDSVKTFSDLCERLSREDTRAAERALSEIHSFRPKLLLNMASSKEDMRVVEAFRGAAKTFLSLKTVFIGVLYSRPAVKAASRKMRPFMLDESAVEAHTDMEEIIKNLLGAPETPLQLEPAPETRPIEAPEAAHLKEAFGFNDNITQQGAIFHVQTEVQAGPSPQIETVVYHGGRIYFAKKTAWTDVIGSGGIKAGIREFAARQHKTALAAIKLNKITLPQG